MSQPCTLETTPEHEVPFLRTKAATVGIVYVRNAADSQILLAKVRAAHQLDFSQSDAYRVSHSYFVLPPKQSVRVKVQVDESRLEATRSSLMRVQACEIKSVGLYKSTSLSELRDEWRRHRSHYEGEKTLKAVLRCLPASFAQDPGSFPQFFSMNSARSGPEELADLSLYPMLDEKAFRSRTCRSPGLSQTHHKLHTWYNEERETLFESLERKQPLFSLASAELKPQTDVPARDPRLPLCLLADNSSSRSRPELRLSADPHPQQGRGLSGSSTTKEASHNGSLTANSKNLSRG